MDDTHPINQKKSLKTLISFLLKAEFELQLIQDNIAVSNHFTYITYVKVL
jgi:hypothetical protein